MSKTQKIKDFFNKKRFKNWDEAFRALTPAMRQHSVRVADYTQVLFDGVCQSSYYSIDEEKPDYLSSAYRDIAYKCGFFHQIGKALNPEEYAVWSDKFSVDEKNNYCRYTVEGKELVEKLQTERYDSNATISDIMIQEACEFHMEYWDGKGFPYGYAGTEISLIAQIVGLAKEMDYLLCERKSESPFEEAVDILLAEEDKRFSARLLDVFRECQPELKNVYKKYIQYTKIMPKTVPLVEKRIDRPMGLTYRQIVHGNMMDSYIFEAVPWFGGVADKPEGRQTFSELEGLLMRTGMIKDVTMYFLYEAADLLARMKNCQIGSGGVLIPVSTAFFTAGNQMECLEKMYADTKIDRRKLLLTVQETLVNEERKILERLKEYMGQGVALVLDNYHPEDMPIEKIREIGFTQVRIAKNSSRWNEIKDVKQNLKNHGISVIDWPSGDTNLTEDELIHYRMNYD